MSSPQSFMVGNAPGGASYAGRLMDFGIFSNLGGDYYAGQQARRANAAATAFPDGIPTIGDIPLSQGGRPDVNKVLDTGAKTGGLPFLQGLLPFLMEPPRPGSGYNIGQAQQPSEPPQAQGPAPSTPDQNHPAGASPANLRAASGANIAAIVSRAGGNPDDPQWAAVARRMGVSDVTDPISPSQARLVQGMVARKQPDQAVTQSPLAGDTTETSINGTGTSPRTGEGAGGAVSGAPGPIATPPGSRVAQAFEDSTGGAGTKSVRTQRVPPSTVPQPAAGAQVPAPPQAPALDERLAPNVVRGRFRTNAEANDAAVRDLNRRIQEQTDFASNVSRLNPQRGEQEFKVLNNLEKQRDQIVDFQGKQREPTSEEKNARASGAGGNPILYEQQKKAGELAQTDLGKVVSGYYGQANTAAAAMKNIQLARSLINQPDFYSGTLEGVNLGWKRIMAGLASTSAGRAMGLDPNDPAPQEAFRKVMAANILQQVDDLKASAGEMGGQQGRIFQSQIELMQKAAQNPDNSLVANRMLTEISYRSAQHAIEMAHAIEQMAETYKAAHGGVLDYGFNNRITDWITKHPVFTDQEMANPVILGAPTLPPAIKDKGQLYAWAKNVGLKAGDPVRTPHGDIRYLDR